MSDSNFGSSGIKCLGVCHIILVHCCVHRNSYITQEKVRIEKSLQSYDYFSNDITHAVMVILSSADGNFCKTPQGNLLHLSPPTQTP